MKDWIPLIEKPVVESARFYGIDRSVYPRRFLSPTVERRFLSRIGFVLRNLPRLLRDAWRDSRFA